VITDFVTIKNVTTKRENGIQIIEEHRIIIPAASAVRDDLPGRVYGGHCVVGVE